MRLLGRLSSFVLGVLFDCAAALAFLLAYAGYNGEGSIPFNLDKAISFNPWSVDFLLRRGKPEDLEKAAKLAPRSSAPPIALALEAETNGDPARALEYLRQAETRDKTFAPLWAQANFFFRQQKWPEFWNTAKKAAQLYQGDLSGLYRLCLRAQASADEVFSRVVPARGAAVRQFLDVLGEEKRHADAAPAVQKLASMARPQDREFLAAYCEEIRLANPALALPLRNHLSERGVLPYAPLDVPAGKVVTNGDFRREPSGYCYDWKVPRSQHLSTRMVSGGGVMISLSGRQPESVVLLSQAVPLEAGRQYRLVYKASTGDIHPSAGIQWRVGGLRSGPLRTPDGEWTFALPPAAGNPELELVAVRETGVAKAEGRLLVERVEIRPASEVASSRRP